MKAYDFIVVGGGLIGSAIAWGIARQGASVALLDEGDTAFRAARGNFGLVWLQGKGLGAPPYMRWSIRAGRLWDDLSAELAKVTGMDVGWRRPGGLHFCFSEADMDARQKVIERTRAEGGDLSIRVLDRADLKGMVRAIGDSVVGASYSPEDSHVNPLLLLRAFQSGLQLAGGEYHAGCPVADIIPGKSEFTVLSGERRFHCRQLVLAAGLGGARLAPMVGMNLPVRPLRGQIIVTERLKPFFGFVGNSVRQTVEGSVLFGSSQEDSGFDDGTDVRTIQKLSANGVRVFPQLEQANVVRVWGSLRVMTPDGLPVYEQSSKFPGAYIVTCHSGVTLASVHALDLAPAIASGRLPGDVSTFTCRRFDVQAA
ncbi:NAD(P)/FAD-dependent oxidoreductase [Microvirga brassicacearum]|uniref:FAD-binding oxidoreductase n=1 Tax=Microvirga brassicacearum TaxID=2580413 RepID=A0A5N3PC58_9HYPH|nr:FAD-dependent oxidoreductase [Microvirga brassicacearum]KAB0267225.1 FAD-binding oxidoreductase [Microvirga brassicacearum]